jgi:sec-independent protein translocase protein TatC
MARAALRPVSHEDRLSLVEHLDELRTRLIICLAAFLACFAVAFWQNDRLLDIMNRPLQKTAFQKGSEDPFEKAANYNQALKALLLKQAVADRALAGEERISPETRRLFAEVADQTAKTARATPGRSAKRPVTLGVGEPFTATFKVAAYAALLLAFPLLLYQAYAFVLPAFDPREREVALPLMLGVPFLFIAGVVFAYYLVLPPAIGFLQNFNDDSYDILLQARDFYSFELLVLLAMGALFQIPIGILAATRLGVVTPKQLRAGRRYAFVAIAVIAALLPGQDPVTMLILMAPLVVLYEGSILFASLLDRRIARARAREEAEMAAAGDDGDLPSDLDTES